MTSLILLATTTVAIADDGPLHACWSPTTVPGPSLDLRTDGTFAFKGESGRFMTQGAEIWLLGNGEPRMGTKWHFAVDDASFTLSKPEDFQYLGSNEYLYLKLTPTDTVWRFSRTPTDGAEACQRAASASPTPPTPAP